MTARIVLTGAAAGAASALVFTVLHDLMISSIWFMLAPMLIAGALCGLCIAWSYGLLVDAPSISGWLRFNGTYLILLFLLGPLSLVVFEPVITIPQLLASPDGLPAHLVRMVLPLTAVYAVFMALVISALYGRGWLSFAAVLAACAVLMLLLGLNIAALGLVYLTSGWLKMLMEMLALVVALDLSFALVFAALNHDWLQRPVRPAAQKS